MIDLSKKLRKYKRGWVMIKNKKYTVMAHANTFEEISDKAREFDDIFIMPASDDYYGFVS